MKKSILILLLISNIITAAAQKSTSEESFYIIKPDGSAAARVEEAAYFAKLSKVDDTCWQWDLYNYMGPLVKSERYKDSKLTQLHGRQHYFKPSGFMDSSGIIINGLHHGTWSFLNDTGKVVIRKEYDNGILIHTTDALNEDTIPNGDSISGIESYFAGGAGAWKRYLEKNLTYPDRAYKSGIKGDVVVQFIVNADGKIQDIDIYRSVEYSLDEETMKMIRNSPKWIAATKEGKPVKSYKRQPIRFKF